MEAHTFRGADSTRWSTHPVPEEYVVAHTVHGQSHRLLSDTAEAWELYDDLVGGLADMDGTIEVRTPSGWVTIPVRHIASITLVTHQVMPG